MSSPVLVNDLLFYVDDGGIVSCLDAATGEAHFRERLGGKFSASPLAAAGVIYLASREGVVTVIEASKTFRVLAQNQLDGGIMASPIVVGDSLILRTDKALYRIASPRR
jgi:outer membrane protein assembly factor BamB